MQNVSVNCNLSFGILEFYIHVDSNLSLSICISNCCFILSSLLLHCVRICFCSFHSCCCCCWKYFGAFLRFVCLEDRVNYLLNKFHKFLLNEMKCCWIRLFASDLPNVCVHTIHMSLCTMCLCVCFSPSACICIRVGILILVSHFAVFRSSSADSSRVKLFVWDFILSGILLENNYAFAFFFQETLLHTFLAAE